MYDKLRTLAASNQGMLALVRVRQEQGWARRKHRDWPLWRLLWARR